MADIEVVYSVNKERNIINELEQISSDFVNKQINSDVIKHYLLDTQRTINRDNKSIDNGNNFN